MGSLLAWKQRLKGNGARYCQKVVYKRQAHPCYNNWLGSLLDLFLTVDEFYARYDFGEQFRAVEPAPVFLGFQAQFKDHGQCCDSRSASFGSMGSKPDGSEGGFYGIGGP